MDNLKVVNSFQVDHVDRSNKSNTIRIWKENEVCERLVPLFKISYDVWTTQPYLSPLSFPYPPDNVPQEIIDSFHQALVSPDTYLLQALLDFDIISMNVSHKAMHDLFTVFSYDKLVHRFISTVCAVEFAQPALTEGTVLRHNSHLTFLFQVYYDLFAGDFLNNILKPIINKIDDTGYLGIRENDISKIKKVSKLLNWVLDKFVSGDKFITPQIRHMANVLRSQVSLVLKTKHAVFNALSSFFCLRFSNAVISNPFYYEKKGRTDIEIHKISVQFTQLLQLPFNFQLISDRYEYLQELSEQIVDRFEDIYNFVIGISDFKVTEKVKYPKPRKKECDEAIKRLMGYASAGKELLVERYRKLYDGEEQRAAASFAVSNLLSKMFTK
ncbi:GTPase-activator protein [Histomonas meleagridis]|uniref:GTPase-activator protein n=1 Tax=Histomonas meleagridis TaxID=135588 RepID=UPI00355973AF|nr:GTPase-activator protein [Histomonas meleagridis]KAH0798950.1 GTPase-activator protein [Histomonas meleagridis]